jgi:chorismate mutase/prephenate dehydratase
MSVYFLGPSLSYTHTAAKLLAKEENLTPAPTISSVFDFISGEDIGIIPLENSIFGSVLETIDCLALFPDIKICAEATISVNHCIATMNACEKHEITIIISHPQAIGQCSRWIDENLTQDIQRIESSSTARAALELEKYQSDSNDVVAVICSKDCATFHNLVILEEAIQNSSNNMTRFIRVQIQKNIPKPVVPLSYKTLISFSVDHDQPGALSKALLTLNTVQLTRIDSRPSHKKSWEYIFYIEMIGHANMEPLLDALSNVKNVTKSFIYHGSFPSLDG